MQKWEYMTVTVMADARNPNVMEDLKRRWPRWSPPAYAVQAVLLDLDAYGEAGWELVHMQPILGIGDNGDIGMDAQATWGNKKWSNTFFCVFKRPKPE